jgi:hypothetical protein
MVPKRKGCALPRRGGVDRPYLYNRDSFTIGAFQQGMVAQEFHSSLGYNQSINKNWGI